MNRAWPWVLGLLAFTLRAMQAAAQPWYPDEGMHVELALSIARGQAPAIGAIKQNCFFPLSASYLAPGITALWLKLWPGSAIIAARLWTALLGALSAYCLARAGEAMKRPFLGLAAALLFAIWPFNVTLGSWAFYHHLAGALTAGACWVAADFAATGRKRSWLLLCAACGLAAAAAYWTYWLLLLPPLLGWRRKPGAWGWGLLLLIAPLAVFLGMGYLADPGGFWGDIAELKRQTVTDLPERLRPIAPLVAVAQVFRGMPAFGLAVIGFFFFMLQGLKRRDLAASAVAGAAFAASVEAFRQRQNMEAFSYPLILAMPAACFGLGAFVDEGLAWWRRGGAWRGLALALMAAPAVMIFRPVPLDLMHKLSAPAQAARELLAKAAAELHPGDMVFGQSALNWGFPEGVKATAFEQAAAAMGEKSDFLRPDMPASRFVYRPWLQDTKWMIVSSYSYGYTFAQPAARAMVLAAEQHSWVKIWSNSEYIIYANPAFGYAPPRYAEKILNFYNLYDDAAVDAYQRGDFSSARFALTQALAYTGGNRAGRLALLKEVEKGLGVKK